MEVITKYFPELSKYQRKQFVELGELYKEWNAQINVISRKDIDFLYERHVLHSLAIAKVIQFKKGSSILDVGTGGGFPGIPLAIMFPDCYFHLVDSIAKKITVVQAISEDLGLDNVKAEQTRAESTKFKYDFVVTRAVAQTPKLVQWIKNKVSGKNQNSMPNGLFALKGGNLAEELGSYKARIYSLPDYFEEEFFETKKLIYIPKKEF